MAVIAIIAILFVLLIPQINSSVNKARASGVMTDFRSYQNGMHSYFMENKNKFEMIKIFNSYLEKEFQFVTQTDGNSSNKKNPYGYPYQIMMITENQVGIYSKTTDKKYHLLIATTENNEIKYSYFGEDMEKPIERDGEYEYIEFENYVMITDYFGEDKNIIIPTEIKGKKVKRIISATLKNEKSFANKDLESVILPSEIEYIGYYAFQNNKLTNIVFPQTLKSIGEASFKNNKLTEVIIPNQITKIPYNSFSTNQINNLVLNNTTEISSYAFYSNKLTNVNLGNKIKEVGEYAFRVNPITNWSAPLNAKINQKSFPDAATRN